MDKFLITPNNRNYRQIYVFMTNQKNQETKKASSKAWLNYLMLEI